MPNGSHQRKTMSVPEAGAHFFGLGPKGSYAAAARGEIPTVRIGRLKRVPVAACERILEQAGGTPDSAACASDEGRSA